MGAHNRGPIANPRTKRETPRVATSVEMWNVVITSSTPPEKVDEQKATANVAYTLNISTGVENSS
jgi:hypothetical protein